MSILVAGAMTCSPCLRQLAQDLTYAGSWYVYILQMNEKMSHSSIGLMPWNMPSSYWKSYRDKRLRKYLWCTKTDTYNQNYFSYWITPIDKKCPFVFIFLIYSIHTLNFLTIVEMEDLFTFGLNPLYRYVI